MAQDNELRMIVHDLAVATREGFEATHSLIADTREELRGDIARVANMTGAGFEALNKRFDSVDKRLEKIMNTLEGMKGG